MSIRLGTETVQEYLTGVSADLSNYYNKQEVDDLLFNIDIGDKLEPYALKTEIPSLNGYATQEWVEDKKYLTELPAHEHKQYLTEHQDISGKLDKSVYNADKNTFALKTELFSKSYNDLTDKPKIPSLTGYATEEYVNTKLANLVNAAPETLDTLGELATALQENKTVVSALNSSISNKANKSEVYSIDEIEEKDFADKLYVREYVAQELGALDTLLDEIIGG